MQRTREPGTPNELGVDVARFGSDETVIMHRRGPVARLWKAIPMGDTMETAGQVRSRSGRLEQLLQRSMRSGSGQESTTGFTS